MYYSIVDIKVTNQKRPIRIRHWLVAGSLEIVATADKLTIAEDFRNFCSTWNRSIFTSVQVCKRYFQRYFKVIDFPENFFLAICCGILRDFFRLACTIANLALKRLLMMLTRPKLNIKCENLLFNLFSFLCFHNSFHSLKFIFINLYFSWINFMRTWIVLVIALGSIPI